MPGQELFRLGLGEWEQGHSNPPGPVGQLEIEAGHVKHVRAANFSHSGHDGGGEEIEQFFGGCSCFHAGGVCEDAACGRKVGRNCHG